VTQKSLIERNHSLKFKVSHLLKASAGMTRHYLVEDVVPPALSDDLILQAPISGELKFVKTGHNILVTGLLNTVLELPCTRCLEPLDVPIEIELEELFRPTFDIISNLRLAQEDPDDIDEATLIDEQNNIDLTEVIRQSLYLCQPSQITCPMVKQKPCANLTLEDAENSLTLYTKDSPPSDKIDNRWADLLTLKDKLSD
jgi:uncharacterized protein